MGGPPCRFVREGGSQYCRIHEWVCKVPGHGNAVQLGNQDCEKCKRPVEMQLAKEAAEKGEEITKTNRKLKKWAKK